jgi:hypothetical protein
MSREVRSAASDPVALARLIAAGRVAIGLGLVAVPGLFSRVVGGVEPREDAVALARIAGARDLGMGVGALLAARGGATPELRRWVAASAFADAVDAVAIARSRSFPLLPRLAAVSAGAAAALLGALAGVQLSRP